ncbi:MAG: Smr/MutS family protein, partial [Myxococcales bacterium]|nr:Smr/MutS family protein [Myxococcales bacterium]
SSGKKIRRAAAEPLRTWPRNEEAPSGAARHFGATPAPVARGIDNSVDVRGARVDDGLRAVDAFVDETIRRDRDIVIIVHGHGSGILRRAVREHLERQSYVRATRAGLPKEGGDGVTVIWLGDQGGRSS